MINFLKNILGHILVMNKKFDYLLLIFANSLHTGKKREFPGKYHLFPVFPFSRKFKMSGKLSTLLIPRLGAGRTQSMTCATKVNWRSEGTSDIMETPKLGVASILCLNFIVVYKNASVYSERVERNQMIFFKHLYFRKLRGSYTNYDDRILNIFNPPPHPLPSLTSLAHESM